MNETLNFTSDRTVLSDNIVGTHVIKRSYNGDVSLCKNMEQLQNPFNANDVSTRVHNSFPCSAVDDTFCYENVSHVCSDSCLKKGNVFNADKNVLGSCSVSSGCIIGNCNESVCNICDHADRCLGPCLQCWPIVVNESDLSHASLSINERSEGSSSELCFPHGNLSNAAGQKVEAAREVNRSATVPFPFFDESLFGAPDSDTSDTMSNSSTVPDSNPDDNINNNKEKMFTFMVWNINGLQFKMFDKEFLHFVSSFDFVCLVETFMQTVRDDIFPDFNVFCVPATKLPGRGRPSGGVVCLIRKQFMTLIRRLEVKCGNFVVFDVDKQLFGLDKNVLLVCAYVPPEGSSYYTFIDEKDGISMLENCIVDSTLMVNDYYVIVTGDLNSRTSNVSQNVLSEHFYLHPSSHPVNVGRQSQDIILNQYGKLLLNMCTSLNLCILNGMCSGDQEGRYTYVSNFGSSVIDYVLLSSDLYLSLLDNCNLTVKKRIESSHLPVVLSVLFPYENIDIRKKHNVISSSVKYVWDSNHSEVFKERLMQDSTVRQMEFAINMIDVDINSALDKFNNCLKEAAVCMKKRVTNGIKRKQDWFDYECVLFRRKVRKALRKYCRTTNEENRHSYCVLRREYKNLLYRKKKTFNEDICNKLIDSISDQKSFWDVVHNALPNRQFVNNQISLEQWYSHFKDLLEKEQESNDSVLEENEFNNNDYLDRPISKEEVLFAIKKIKLKKASGPDEIIGELIKYSPELSVPFFVQFLNALFERGLYPDSWNESIILPLHKKGNRNDPSNYRGISLCNIGSKIYSFIINKRLQQWAEENNVTGEYQAGFKKNYSTTDHIFTLLACVQKQFSANYNRKLYVAFIDFEKAFDSINRNYLWGILVKQGISGKLFQCLKSMYQSVKAKVRSGFKLTDCISCTAGVKQGDILSPVLFTLFINELAVEIIKNGRHGVNFPMDTLELFILLLADDIVLLSETIVGLQTQLNNLNSKSISLGLNVNLNKSNIIVFRKGGYLGWRERWFLGQNNVVVVNAYKYLGIYFTTMLSFTAACNDLVSKAKRATICLLRKLRELNVFSFELFFKLFDAQIQPIALYGSEIWGLDNAASNCEKVHLFAMKKLLGVEMRTPNDFVYSELNRFPLVINAIIRCIRYWLKIARMEPHRLPKKSYIMLRRLDEKGSRTWATNVRVCLFQHGFGYVWLNNGVENVNVFLRLLRQRLIDCQWQNLNDHVQTSNRFIPYRSFACNINSNKTYLTLGIDRHVKFIMTRFRFGVSDLAVHRNRYKHFLEDNSCPLCNSDEDNEIHFLLCCPNLLRLRRELIPEKYYRYPNAFRLSLLLACQNRQTLRNLCIYVYKAFKIREISLS